jgi:hypothetical protein
MEQEKQPENIIEFYGIKEGMRVCVLIIQER